MNPLKENLRAALNFTASEKRALFILILIMFMVGFAPIILNLLPENDSMQIELSYLEFEKHIENIENAAEKNEKTFSEFDPNSISVEELKMMPIPEYVAERIVKYRKSGGAYNKKEDLKKIYGLSDDLYESLEPFLIIKEITPEIFGKEKSDLEKDLQLDLNLCDSLDLIQLKGIGPAYASRIIKYRRLLGGYVSKDQLKDVYGFTDSLFALLTVNFYIDENVKIDRIPINQVTFKELIKHPYFRNYNLSRAIINYRTMNGPYKNESDLKKNHLMNDSILNKITPYILF